MIVSFSISCSICALKSNGKVLVHSKESYLQTVQNWYGIIKIVGTYHALWGLRADGTVVAAVDRKYQSDTWNVENWHNIVNIYFYHDYLYGVKADGTTLVAGDGSGGIYTPNIQEAIQCDELGTTYLKGDYYCLDDGRVLDRRDRNKSQADSPVIAQDVISTDGETLFLKADGTVGYTTYSGISAAAREWTNILALYKVDFKHTLGLRSDGTILTACDFGATPLDLSGWKLFDSIDTIGQEQEEIKKQFHLEQKRREEEARQREEELRRIAEEAHRIAEEKRRKEEKAETERLKRIDELTQKKLAAQKELSGLGFLAFKRKKELEEAIAYYDREITKLGG